MAVLNVRDYGAKGNANHYNEADGNWYQDPLFTQLADDDTLAFQNCFANAGLFNSVYIPIGNYLIRGTVWAKSGTEVFGEDEYLSKFCLGFNHSLDSIPFRDGEGIMPILTTDDDSQDTYFHDFSMIGNKRHIIYTEWGVGGLVPQKTVNSKAERVHIDWINLRHDKASRGYGFNFISVDADNIEYFKCSGEYSGYQIFGFFDRTKNGVMNDCDSGMGWRTSAQIHRDTENCKILNSRIIQEDNPFETEPHGAVTIHGEPNEEVRGALIDGNYIKIGSAHKAAIQAFRKSLGLTVTNNEIWSNGEGLRFGDADSAVAEHNKIFALPNEKELEYGNIGINVVDGTKDSRVKYNKVVGFDTPIHEDANLANDISDNETRGFKIQQARLFKNVNGKITEVKPYKKSDGMTKEIIPYVKH